MNAKLTRSMRLAIQEGKSSNPETNNKLASIIDDALKKNMSMTTINNVLKKFKENQTQLKRHFVELKFLNKIVLIAEYYTENLIILENNVNTILRKEPKASTIKRIGFFDDYGLIQVSLPSNVSFKTPEEFEEKVTEDAIVSDAQEVEEVDFASKTATLTCNPEHIDRVKSSLKKLGYIIDFSDEIFIPKNTVVLTDEERKLYDSLLRRLKLLEGLEKIHDNVEESE